MRALATLFLRLALGLSLANSGTITLADSTPTVFHYEPATIKLAGKIEQQTFPGPPNYESIAHGDKIEKGWYLRLSEPVDVVETKDDAPSANSETEKNVRILQLTWNYDDLKLKKEIRRATTEKKTILLTGYLFHRWNGHHHSRVLMSVDKLEEIIPHE